MSTLLRKKIILEIVILQKVKDKGWGNKFCLMEKWANFPADHIRTGTAPPGDGKHPDFLRQIKDTQGNFKKFLTLLKGLYYEIGEMLIMSVR